VRWKELRLPCTNKSCSGEWDPKTEETKPYQMQYIGRRFWAHGFRCPGCSRTLWLQSEPWSRFDYDLSPIQQWGFWAYTFVISFLAILVGMIVYQFSSETGFYLLSVATVTAFVGGIGLVRTDIQEVSDGKKGSHDKRLLLPLFISAILLPILFLLMDAEPLLLWAVPGCLVIGYLVGSVWETRFY
jgi:hypothetical protein